jgi:hypothetical protein
MGYGHQRAVAPLRPMARGRRVLTAGVNDGATPAERTIWRVFRFFYEAFSRLQSVPVCGRHLARALDFFLRIQSLYPKRSQAAATWQVWFLDRLIRAGLCRGILRTIRTDPHPLVTSFYAPALAADRSGYTPVNAIICDTDLSRAWVPPDPSRSRINYFAPCKRAVQRLVAYGVPRERVQLTGFPLPDELVGGPELTTLRPALAARLRRLDPKGRFWQRHYPAVKEFLRLPDTRWEPPAGPLTVVFAVGGAGAQQNLGAQIAAGLRECILGNQARLVISAGTRPGVRDHFMAVSQRLFPNGPQLEVVYGKTMDDYLRAFTVALARADVLWTKPSEMVFYCALGLPLLLAPAIGIQERYNARWVYEIQAGFKPRHPRYAGHWLFDLVKDGRLAEAAWAGFLKARKLGTENIRAFLRTGGIPHREPPLY